MSPEARDHSFDELTRGLASGSISRGKALRLMGAALVGGALASVGIGEASADDCKRNGKRCKKDKQCCSGNCEGGTCAAACTSNSGSCTSGSECCSGNCKSGTCVESCIPPNAITCDGTDPDTCPGGINRGCTCSREASGGAYCATVGTNTPCTTSCDCPTGQFCRSDFPRCAVVAEVCPRS
jgi:hypothetical protein